MVGKWWWLERGGGLLTSLDLQAESWAWKWSQDITLEALLPAPQFLQPDPTFQRSCNVSKVSPLGDKVFKHMSLWGHCSPNHSSPIQRITFVFVCVWHVHMYVCLFLCLWCVHMNMLFVCVYAYIWYLCVHGLLFVWVHIFVSVCGDRMIALGIILDYSLPYSLRQGLSFDPTV